MGRSWKVAIQIGRTLLAPKTVLTGVVFGAFLVQSADATEFPMPSRPVRIIVPYGAGNTADVAARLIVERLSERFGVPFVVENRAGANGIIGTNLVAKAPGDGHTLLMTSMGPIVINPTVHKKLPYDPQRDLAPVAPIMSNVMMLVSSRSFPATSVAEAVRVVKASPGKYAYGTYGPGSLNQLIMLAFARSAGLQMIEVGYKAGNEAHTALLSGTVGLMWDTLSNVYSQVRGGKLNALAVSAAQRSTLAPEVPTLRESGVALSSNFQATAWTGMFAPASTPRDIVERLNQEVTRSINDPAIRAKFTALSSELFAPHTPEQFADFIQEEQNRWAETATEAGLKHSQ